MVKFHVFLCIVHMSSKRFKNETHVQYLYKVIFVTTTLRLLSTWNQVSLITCHEKSLINLKVKLTSHKKKLKCDECWIQLVRRSWKCNWKCKSGLQNMYYVSYYLPSRAILSTSLFRQITTLNNNFHSVYIMQNIFDVFQSIKHLFFPDTLRDSRLQQFFCYIMQLFLMFFALKYKLSFVTPVTYLLFSSRFLQ